MSHTPCLLLVAPRFSYRIAPYLQAAQRLGVEVFVASNGEQLLLAAGTDGIALEFSDLNSDVERILGALDGRELLGVIPTDDSTAEISAAVAARLGVPANPVSAMRFSRRKDLARARLKQCAVATPRFETRRFDDLIAGKGASLGFPVVIKPLSLSGSRGVIRANNSAELVEAALRVAALVASHPELETRELALLEEFVPGREFALEGMLANGELTVLALFDKPDPLDGPFFEETYYVMPARIDPDLHRRIAETVAAACAAYGLRVGPVHAEVRVNGDAPMIIEVAARTIGGQCARLVTLASGLSVEEMVIAEAMGAKMGPVELESAAGVMMIPTPKTGVLRRIEGLSAARKVSGLADVSIDVREGAVLTALPEGESYLGFLFATGESADAVEQTLRTAYSKLSIVVAPILASGAVRRREGSA